MLFTDFAAGFWLGFLLMPFLKLFETALQIIVNAWLATRKTACTNDCNQGRNCTCKVKTK